jgi:hypothetical protein
MGHFTALAFFPCYGRLPLSGVFLYLDDTLAALYRCHAGGLCASLVSLEVPTVPTEARVWVFSSLCFSGFQAEAGKQPGLSCTNLLCNSRRSGHALVLQSPSTWAEVTPILSYPGQTLRASPQRLIAVSLAEIIFWGFIVVRWSVKRNTGCGCVSTMYTRDVMQCLCVICSSFTPRFNQRAMRVFSLHQATP